MKLISENPAEKYLAIGYNGKSIFLNKNDATAETIENAKAFCKKHRYSVKADKAVAVYYLRGNRHHADYEQVLKGVVYSESFPEELNEIVHCLTFWNQEGGKSYAMNKTGDESYSDFILKCFAADCRAFVAPFPEQFITGKGGHHVWVDDRHTNQRILLIHF